MAWKAGNAGTIATVKSVMGKNNILVTRRSYQAKGGLFDQQIMKKGKGQVPIKGSDERLDAINKYGGYNKATGTYFMLVESEDKKGKRIRTIEYVPLHLCDRIEKDERYAERYLEKKEHELKNPKILIPKIKIDTLFKVDGFYMWLSGRSDNRLVFKGANQLIISEQDARILKKVIKYVNRRKENKNAVLAKQDGLSEEDLTGLYDVFLDKLKHTVYRIRLSAQEKTLSDNRDDFLELCKEDKCIVLSEILHIFQCQSSTADLKLIHGPGNAGKILLNNAISKHEQISIIYQSPAGIYVQEMDLKKV